MCLCCVPTTKVIVLTVYFSSLSFAFPGSKSTKKTFDLNTQTDTFFAQYASVLFPDVVDANTKELAEVQTTFCVSFCVIVCALKRAI